MPPGDLHPARPARPEPGGEAAQGLVETMPQTLDEGPGVQRLADRGVVDVAVLLEVRGQVGLGIPPPSSAGNPDLSPPDRIPK